MNKIIKYWQEKVVFLPKKLPEKYHFQFQEEFEELVFNTPFEGKINALFFKVKNPKGVILYFHGNADNLKRWGKITRHFTHFQYNILVPDYRGYGKSDGERNEETMLSDAQFCYDFLKEQYQEEDIIVYGRSLGGAFATKIASQNSPKLLVLECTFYNLEDMARRWISAKITSRLSPKMVYHFLSNERIKEVKSPVVQLHGNRDFVVPIHSGKKLFDEIPHQRKTFVEIEGGSHDDLYKFPLFQNTLKEIFN